MKRFFTVLLAGLLLVAVTAPAIAWEFEMKGEYEYRFRYLGRTGQHDLFGYDVPNALVPAGTAAEVGFAGPNIYGHPAATAHTLPAPNAGATAGNAYAMITTQGGYSTYGSDAIYNDSRLTLYPDIKVNPAIRVFGALTMGGLRNKYAQPAVGVPGASLAGVGVPPLERYYVAQSTDNAYDTASFISVEQFRTTVQMPWGTLAIGVKDFPYGIGTTTAYSTRSEGVLLVIPYGPFRFMPAIWLARNATNAGYGTEPDGDRKPTYFWGFLFTYQNGPVDCGGGPILQNYHGKNAYDTASANGRGGYDQFLSNWASYFKYNNGRFFLNAEYDWTTISATTAALNQNYAGTPAQNNAVAPKNTELYHWLLEVGAMAGPAKVSLMTATASGPVLNNPNPTKSYANWPINYQALEPYEWLMFNTYGGGNDAFSGTLAPSDGHGMMTDAFCYAGRVDYAVAANLNVWATYMWAHRLEKQGYLFGGKYSDGTPANAAAIAAFAANAGRVASTYQVGGVTGTTYGYVTDGYLGWEANAGVDWKVLENMTFFFRYAYWQPGDWFKEAYQTKGVRAGAYTPNNPLESRDAINAFHGSLMINF